MRLPQSICRFAALFLALAAAATAGMRAPAAAGEAVVEVINRSKPTLCAEEDNVQVELLSPTVRRFRLEATHPAYVATLQSDRIAPDLTNCTDFPADPDYALPPERVAVHEGPDWQLVGYRFTRFWRPTPVPLLVRGRVHHGLHLLQLWAGRGDDAEEVLAVYPGDGYWRIRPLPPGNLPDSAYGSSVLVGPVEEAGGRPIVAIKDMAFEPSAGAFTMRFLRGGSARLRVAELDRERLVLDVAFDRAVPSGHPFAALRSMWVAERNSDVAWIAWRAGDGSGWRRQPIMSFGQARAAELWLGRIVPSDHNSSAPDLRFGGFAAGNGGP